MYPAVNANLQNLQNSVDALLRVVQTGLPRYRGVVTHRQIRVHSPGPKPPRCPCCPFITAADFRQPAEPSAPPSSPPVNLVLASPLPPPPATVKAELGETVADSPEKPLAKRACFVSCDHPRTTTSRMFAHRLYIHRTLASMTGPSAQILDPNVFATYLQCFSQTVDDFSSRRLTSLENK